MDNTLKTEKKMKLSKIDNRNTAVGVKKGEGPEGILYKDYGVEQDISKVVEKTVNSVFIVEKEQIENTSIPLVGIFFYKI